MIDFPSRPAGQGATPQGLGTLRTPSAGGVADSQAGFGQRGQTGESRRSVPRSCCFAAIMHSLPSHEAVVPLLLHPFRLSRSSPRAACLSAMLTEGVTLPQARFAAPAASSPPAPAWRSVPLNLPPKPLKRLPRPSSPRCTSPLSTAPSHRSRSRSTRPDRASRLGDRRTPRPSRMARTATLIRRSSVVRMQRCGVRRERCVVLFTLSTGRRKLAFNSY